MFLSQLTLNPLDRLARKDMSNPYELHRTISKGFSNDRRANGRILFRLEPPASPQEFGGVVLVQSWNQPDWSELADRRRYLLVDPQVRSIPQLHLKTGEVLRFRLRANPARRLAQSGQRVALLSTGDRIAWLTRKAGQSGFRLVDGTVNHRDTGFRTFDSVKKDPADPGSEISCHLTVHMVDYDGLLQVADPDMLWNSVCNGIGPAKGLGCGLLSLARV